MMLMKFRNNPNINNMGTGVRGRKKSSLSAILMLTSELKKRRI